MTRHVTVTVPKTWCVSTQGSIFLQKMAIRCAAFLLQTRGETSVESWERLNCAHGAFPGRRKAGQWPPPPSPHLCLSCTAWMQGASQTLQLMPTNKKSGEYTSLTFHDFSFLRWDDQQPPNFPSTQDSKHCKELLDVTGILSLHV